MLGELPVNNVSLDCQLNSAGNMSAGGHLDDPRIDNASFIGRTTPGRTAFWAYRGSQIVWGGIILSREYQSSGKSLTLTGQTFECYAANRFPRSVIGTAVQALSMGQSAMIDTLWQQLQSATYGNIGVLPANVPGLDPATTLTVNGYDLSTSYADLINSITQLDGGPDWTIIWSTDANGNPQKQLVVGAPIGNPVGMTDLEVDYPGAILNYTYTENASSGKNQWWAVGDGTGATTTVGEASDLVSLNSGVPLWEGVNNYSGVTVQATINSHANSDIASLPQPLITHAIDLAGEAFPMFGSYGLGDYVTVNVQDARWPAGLTFNVRCIGWSIQPPDEGQGTEQVNLVFDEVTGVS
jgi:hypothetical protein